MGLSLKVSAVWLEIGENGRFTRIKSPRGHKPTRVWILHKHRMYQVVKGRPSPRRTVRWNCLTLIPKTCPIVLGTSLKSHSSQVSNMLTSGPSAHLLTRSRRWPVHGVRCAGHASKQAGKALRSQGHPNRTKRSTILATLKQKKVCTETHQGMYTDGFSHGLR